MKNTIVTTTMGDFIIDGMFATLTTDTDCYYTLPSETMTTDEIRNYLNELHKIE